MAMPQREVEVGGHKYKFYLIGGSEAFKASRKFTAKTTALFPCLAHGKVEEFNDKLLQLVMDGYVLIVKKETVLIMILVGVVIEQ